MMSLRVVICLAVMAPAAASAANYRQPYTNVDPRNDAGNDTGDGVTDQLNAIQLQRPGVRSVPVYPGYARVLPPPVYYAPPRYYTPPAGYVVAPAYPAYGYGW